MHLHKLTSACVALRMNSVEMNLTVLLPVALAGFQFICLYITFVCGIQDGLDLEMNLTVLLPVALTLVTVASFHCICIKLYLHVWPSGWIRNEYDCFVPSSRLPV